jgi:hypothetical protein
MVSYSSSTSKKEISPEMELLNQACLDLVAQIEQLKKENARLKRMREKGSNQELD